MRLNAIIISPTCYFLIVETNLDEEEQEILLILLNEQQEKSDYEKIQDGKSTLYSGYTLL